MGRFSLHACVFVFLTLLTQIGGLAWLFALMARRRLVVFGLTYVALSVGATLPAPQFGRVALPCIGGAPPLASPMYCALNRHYVSPQMKDVLSDLARAVPGTRVLDANFPFFDGFPLLPHLSHDDGDKADVALYHAGPLPSPLGYFAFEDGPSDCPDQWASLRWNMSWLRPLWRDTPLDEAATAQAVRHLSSDPRVGKIFLEPHLVERLGVAHPKVRFQGCRAARHDDHIHLQL